MTPLTPVLLFDLGGVLVDVAPLDHMIESLGLPPGEPVASWVAANFWAQFETGELDATSFCEHFIREFGLALQPAQMLTVFEAWNRRMLPGALDLLAELRSRYRLAVLSNTNEVHWRRLTGEFGIPLLVEGAFASHLIGLRKPDARAYLHVARELGVEPGDLVFFDDNADNVEAALTAGLKAHQVLGVEELRGQLQALGYL